MLFGLLYYLSVSSKLLIILIFCSFSLLYLLYIMKKEEKWYKDSLRNQKSINDVAFSKIKSLWHSTLNDLTAFFNSYYLLQRKKYYKTEQEIELKHNYLIVCLLYYLLF
ncbi:multidrug ABC transporter [Erysipelothrix rhusiopathiae]|nr:multidrug ABC transporter [Erysipelothrix rhusiopathiae]